MMWAAAGGCEHSTVTSTVLNKRSAAHSGGGGNIVRGAGGRSSEPVQRQDGGSDPCDWPGDSDLGQ